ncbi:MAG TPA: cytochrome d ubiquinol oxidase subunit II, partial [Firmicutes bacterium]|nr:cytochrome d ubiquinol oxidase subunit II [Bacillota bacterium]
MVLSVLWFVLVAVLFVGFFFLEGFDYGVGTLLPFLGRTDDERRQILRTIGPVWGGNEVWMITAGGALFAAFPNWYATLFSGLYVALFLMLLALIGRGVAVEFRPHDARPGWRAFWDWVFFAGSAVPALLWGVALGNLAHGVPIDARMQYAGTFWTLLNPYALVGGVALLLLFLFHGALFLSLKLEGELATRARRAAAVAGALVVPAFALLAALSHSQTDFFAKAGPGVLLWLLVLVLLGAWGLARSHRPGWAFAASGLAVVAYTAAVFWGMFPRVLISSLDPAWSLTVFNSSSSPYTLKVMTIAALTLVPVVLLYQ